MELLKNWWNKIGIWAEIPEGSIKAFFHTLWHTLGTLLPLLIAIILSYIFQHTEHIKTFIDEGDFCLFSAAILTPASYILSSYKRKDTDNILMKPSIFYAISVLMILITAVLFAGTFTKSIFPCLPINYKIVEWVSVIFLFVSIFIFYYSQKLHYTELPGSKSIEIQNVDDINDDFDNLQ